MRKRLLVGIPLALALIGLLLLDGWLSDRVPPTWPLPLPGVHVNVGQWLCNGFVCALVLFTLTILGTHELVCLARARGYRPFGRTAQLFAAILVIGPYISFNLKDITGAYDESWGLMWMAFALAFVFFLQAARHKTENAMENLAITVFIIFYAGGLGGFMTKLRMEVGGSTGVAVLLFSIFLVKITDAAAYFTGYAFGRHKMIEWLSPKKTWEGFCGGVLATIVLAVVLGHWLHVAGIIHVDERFVPHPVSLLWLGFLMAGFSVAGDLCASLLKRDAKVKDSGQVLPGLGGILDIVDSPLLAAPMAWLFWTRMCHVIVPQ
jgi:phosphatidate cytidylyltransferase